MERKFLKDLGLEAETIDSILNEHHSELSNFKDQLSEKKNELKELKTERDELKSKADEGQDAQDKINSLKSKYDEAVEEKEKLQKQIESSELDKQIIQNVKDAHDVDDVLNFLDKESFERDEEGNITNFEDVINQVREKKPHYFATSSQSNNDEGNEGGEGGEGQEGNEGTGGIEYKTGKGKGVGGTGTSDLIATGKQWAEKLGGKSNG